MSTVRGEVQSCERQGITAWQYDYTDKAVEVLRILRKGGSRLKVICLHAERPFDAPLKAVIGDTTPVAIVHHGGVTDSQFRAGKADKVRDFVKKVKDQGLLAGVSSHCPDNIKRIADAGWENDFFMTCFYYLTRPVEEQRRQLGKVAVGEPFFDTDPADMTAVVRKVAKPCLGFKILAAGRACWSKPSVDEAFKYAFENIKPIDAVLVGMFPRYSDQVAENAALARKYGVIRS
jgi:predicted aldo/keto reductase-like oxidoreductase